MASWPNCCQIAFFLPSGAHVVTRTICMQKSLPPSDLRPPVINRKFISDFPAKLRTGKYPNSVNFSSRHCREIHSRCVSRFATILIRWEIFSFRNWRQRRQNDKVLRHVAVCAYCAPTRTRENAAARVQTLTVPIRPARSPFTRLLILSARA